MEQSSHTDILKIAWVRVFGRQTPILVLLHDDPAWEEVLTDVREEMRDYLEADLPVEITTVAVEVPA